jgi:hypothetical protein
MTFGRTRQGAACALALLGLHSAAAGAGDAPVGPVEVRLRQDPFQRLRDLEQGRIASNWSSLPASADCTEGQRELALHALALAEPSRAAEDTAGSAFDLIDPRYRAQLDATARVGCVFGQLTVQRQVGRDGDSWAMDGSALAWQIDPHWRVAGGLIARQWGPGWDGSLILGGAARALPSVSVDADSGPIAESNFWSWLGQVQFTGFLGRLEQDRRDYDHPWLMGMRLVVRPWPWLELGASRVAQLGGAGRDNSLGTFWKAILGSDNQDGPDGSATQQPGNQLGGFDARLSLDRWLPGVALYGQMIGEDEAANLPSKYMWLGGASWRGTHGLGFVEWTDSEAGQPGVAYNHHIYTDGYRFHGRPLGHWVDGDSKLFTVGVLLHEVVGGQALAVLRTGRLNDSGANPTWPRSKLLGASAEWRRFIDRSLRLTLAVDFQQLRSDDAAVAGGQQTQLRAQLDWWH